jgi:hypothetical protein
MPKYRDTIYLREDLAGAWDLELLFAAPEWLLRLLLRFPLCELTPGEDERDADFRPVEPEDPDLLAGRLETVAGDLREAPELFTEGEEFTLRESDDPDLLT